MKCENNERKKALYVYIKFSYNLESLIGHKIFYIQYLQPHPKFGHNRYQQLEDMEVLPSHFAYLVAKV